MDVKALFVMPCGGDFRPRTITVPSAIRKTTVMPIMKLSVRGGIDDDQARRLGPLNEALQPVQRAAGDEDRAAGPLRSPTGFRQRPHESKIISNGVGAHVLGSRSIAASH